MKEIGKRMFATRQRLYYIAEDVKIYHVQDDAQDGRERKDSDNIDQDIDLCESCRELVEENGFEDLPNDCDEYDCATSFVSYRIEKEKPNLRAGVFFTAKAAADHIAENKHHYNDTVKIIPLTPWRNQEMVDVITHLTIDIQND